ncbi:Error-prone repair protein UmuD [Pseudomonas syringae pv. coriandricola]|uniref:Error-prone repair protein UmuD n=3 Tax=Pseudomonas TaxID=286 RepID=A0A0P9QS62_9PSED|nr:Ultraviolet light resistance protein A [Pseudomonas syringae pv. coriandricola]RMN07402.1 Error-prone repair protein UmuD [Pseudomonas syringae pv. coriandricola]
MTKDRSSTFTVYAYSKLPNQANIMTVRILGKLSECGIVLPFYSFKIPAGFPNPAADHIEQDFSFDRLMDVRAPHIYVAQIDGSSMQGIGIFDGDLIVVDRSLTAVHGSIVIASVNGEPLCKRLTMQGQNVVLISENPGYAPRYILEGEELVIWGVVKHGVRTFNLTS